MTIKTSGQMDRALETDRQSVKRRGGKDRSQKKKNDAVTQLHSPKRTL